MELLKRWRLGLLWCWLLSTAGVAQDDLGIRLKTSEPTLTVSPNICELEDDASSCTVTVALVWEVPKAGRFCLYYEQSKLLLQCWENAYSGAHRFTFDSGLDGTFLLTRGEGGPVAASAQLNVIGAIEQQLRARRRSGFWRIF